MASSATDTSEPRMNSDVVSSHMHAAICHNKILLLMHLSILSQRGKKDIWDFRIYLHFIIEKKSF